ncbi:MULTISPECIES: hypothetical protein [Serratia]|uniref:hypothetical protein n=1 Tax=Serratia TaxID=613 RepID=UPI0015718A93|nr:hypothetical protein [Serratia marcescens]MDE1509099.1 hypothetical protein [Serratia nevei]MBH2637293.1 hypothetical protein [Serratia marcescens]NSM55490.1 hypothetical protein [Serratia marcescens]HED2348563.1 hypothetical protein [Serratia marcescens]HED2396493.1 hypothetical protein [Serratia marcescens]
MSNPNPNKENRFAPKDWAAVPTKEIITLLGIGNITVNGLSNWQHRNGKSPNIEAAIKTHRIVEKIKKHNAEIEELGMSSLTMYPVFS